MKFCLVRSMVTWYYKACLLRYTEKLKDDQVKKISKIQFDFKKEIVDLKADLKIATLDFSEVMSTDTYSMHDAAVLINEISDIVANVQKERLLTIVDVLETLTPEQRKKVHAMHLEKFSYSDFILDP